ncbi:hypothetical protein L6452_44462 [Arctium lappa]|uniref:Uncharacterized protein n=1 Tax=Arctium lappa TaxID=4217 RepID=A0ACB8XF58_ARCLA|nr:hypothetical protein L6452_44462 [Arctium lappa]
MKLLKIIGNEEKDNIALLFIIIPLSQLISTNCSLSNQTCSPWNHRILFSPPNTSSSKIKVSSPLKSHLNRRLLPVDSFTIAVDWSLSLLQHHIFVVTVGEAGEKENLEIGSEASIVSINEDGNGVNPASPVIEDASSMKSDSRTTPPPPTPPTPDETTGATPKTGGRRCFGCFSCCASRG